MIKAGTEGKHLMLNACEKFEIIDIKAKELWYGIDAVEYQIKSNSFNHRRVTSFDLGLIFGT